MDWSSVFEDEGEEDGNWVREEISSRTRIFSLFGKDGYTPLVCYAFTVNYILGVGCLGIPYAFLQSGMVLGSILVVVLSLVSYLTVLWIAEATQQEITIAAYHLTKSTNPFIMSPFSSQVRRNHRVRNTGLPKHGGAQSKASNSDSQTTGNILMTSIKSVLSSATMESFGLLSSASTPTNPHSTLGGKVNNYSALSPVEGSMHQHTLEEELHFASLPSSTRLTNHYHHSNHHAAPQRTKSSASMAAHSRMSSQENLHASTNPQQHQQQQLLQQQTLDRMTVQELEVTDLAEEFLGPMGKVLYQSALMALTYVGLLAYTQVFNDTFRLQIWPTVPAWLPPLLFGAIVVPLSCFDLQEQIAAQVAMSILRFVSLGILVVGTFVALCVDYEHSALAMAASSGGVNSHHLPLVRWQGFGVMFTTAIFSQLFQHSVPGLIRPLSKDNKKFVPNIFRAALITTASLYVLTGCICVAYFGNRLSQSVNLDFVGFTWGLSREDGKETATLILVQALAMVVVLFPALDTLSVFPLIAITLGNNLHAACPQVTHALFGHLSASAEDPTAPSSLTTPSADNAATHTIHKNSPRKRYATVFWRLVAAIPPVLCSLEVRHLVVSLQIAGLCGILVALVFPALLHRHAQERSAMLPLSWTTTPSYTLYLSFSWSLWPWATSNPPGSSATANGEAATGDQIHPSPGEDTTVVVTGVLVVAAAALAISIYQML